MATCAVTVLPPECSPCYAAPHRSRAARAWQLREPAHWAAVGLGTPSGEGELTGWKSRSMACAPGQSWLRLEFDLH